MSFSEPIDLPGRPAAWWGPCRDRWLAWRDRRIADPGFQRWASAFPLTRPIARRKAAALFDLVAGFVYSQVLLACVRLRLFDLLADGPLAPEALALRMNLPPAGALRLLDAAVALRLLQRRSDGRYGLGELGAPMVGNRAIEAMVEHHALLYGDLADPVALLRAQPRTGLSDYWPYAGNDDPRDLPAQRVAPYSALMSASQPLVAQQVLDAYPFESHACLLDVGGGEGGFVAAVAARTPALRLMLFDLPAVAERARERFAALGLASRTRCVGGSFLGDALPRGADIATLVRVIHDHDDDAALAILRAVHRALPPGGVLLIAEPMAGTQGAESMGDAYFGFYLLAMGRGRPRSVAALTSLMHDAGFVRVRLMPTRLPLQAGLLYGVTPSA